MASAPDRWKIYTDFIKEYEPGHMQLVSGYNGYDCKIIFYLPHHLVFKHDGSTTKLRVALDASAKSTNAHSLNDNIFFIRPTVQGFADASEKAYGACVYLWSVIYCVTF